MINIFQIGLCGSMIISLSVSAAARSALEHLSALKEGVSSEHVEELKLAPDMAVQVLVPCDSNMNVTVREGPIVLPLDRKN